MILPLDGGPKMHLFESPIRLHGIAMPWEGHCSFHGCMVAKSSPDSHPSSYIRMVDQEVQAQRITPIRLLRRDRKRMAGTEQANLGSHFAGDFSTIPANKMTEKQREARTGTAVLRITLSVLNMRTCFRDGALVGSTFHKTRTRNRGGTDGWNRTSSIQAHDGRHPRGS
jgi:hypothetical protein